MVDHQIRSTVYIDCKLAGKCLSFKVRRTALACTGDTPFDGALAILCQCLLDLQKKFEIITHLGEEIRHRWSVAREAA